MVMLRKTRTTKAVLLAGALSVLGAAAGLGTWSAFSSTTTNSGNTFTAGTVTLTDNDANAAMITMTAARPNDSASSCIKVTYTGSLASTVRAYATTTFTSGSSLAPYLNLTVTRGTDATDPFPVCTNFTADATNYIGAGAGVVYNGTLAAFPTTYAAGLVDPTSGSPATWNTNDNHVYKFVVTVQDNNLAQGLNATTAFTWEARNT